MVELVSRRKDDPSNPDYLSIKDKMGRTPTDLLRKLAEINLAKELTMASEGQHVRGPQLL